MSYSQKREIVWDPGRPNPKQREFFRSRAAFTAYGGAKGGGKTWAVRVKAVGGAIYNPGIRILIMRRTYPELEENHIRPILKLAPQELFSYNGSSRLMTFKNGSTIKFGHWSGEESEREYQGLEFDWIFIDEATQFTERAFNFLGGCLRGVNSFPKRMYLTCNPGGVGHYWVKRLFIDRDYRTNPDNPEEDEDPDDYLFIPATVEDNTALINSSPGYLRMLANMPEDLRAAYRYGRWDAIGGCYFPEFRREIHVCPRIPIQANWKIYASIDYGLDALVCLWWAVDENGRRYVFREWKAKGLIARDAARGIMDRTLPWEGIEATFAPPDLWSRQKDTGRTIAEIFAENGVPLTRTSSNRVQGHMMIKEALALREDGRPGILFFSDIRETVRDLSEIQADGADPNDCATEPHERTHTVDALRYCCVTRVAPAPKNEARIETWDSTSEMRYEDYMTSVRGDPKELYF